MGVRNLAPTSPPHTQHAAADAHMSVCRRQRLVIAMASKLQSDADSPSEVDAELNRLCVPASCRQPGAIGRLRRRAPTKCIVRVRRHKQRLLVPTSLELRAGTDAIFGKWARGLSHHRGGSGGPTCLMGADIAPCCIAFPCAVQRCARSARQSRRQTTRRTRAASAAVRRAARRTAYDAESLANTRRADAATDTACRTHQRGRRATRPCAAAWCRPDYLSWERSGYGHSLQRTAPSRSQRFGSLRRSRRSCRSRHL
jgi:hypothetical protein